MDPLNTVLIFRHCLRSTPFTVYGDPAYTNIDNYTAHTFPEWSVPEYECLPRGLELLQAAGEQIFPSLPTPVKFRIDSSAKRDNDTAIALMEGMGLDTSVGVFEPCLFDPSDEGCYCDPQDTAEKTEAISKRLEEYAPPSDYENLLDKMQFTLGTGVAPSIADIANFVSGGYFTGGSSVASDVAEIFLMQMGGGIDFAWGEIDRETVYNYLQAHIYYRGVQDRAFEVNLYDHSYMSSEILRALGDQSGGTTTIVGHDGDLDAIASIFGLQWHTNPFPVNATTPGSALRIDVGDNGAVEVSVLYQIFDGSDEVKEVKAEFTHANGGSLEDLSKFVNSRTTNDCVP